MFNRNRLTAVLAVSLGSLALTASASAAQRIASATGSGIQCTPASPCELRTAVESASAGDEVIVRSGRYSLSSPLQFPGLATGLDVHGEAGQPRPRISASGENGITINATNRIADLEIEFTGRNTGLSLFGGLAERVIVHSTGDNACGPFGEGADSAVLRDSVCWNTRSGPGGWAIATSAGSTAPISITPKLRNVTAVTTSPSAPAIHASAGNNTQITVDARNVIALAPGVDISAENYGVGGSRSIVTLRTSSFANVAVSGGASSASSPSSNGNQSAAPSFVDASAGDFHQVAGSPTIDAGSVDAQVGFLDLDRAERIQHGNADIGADEFNYVATPSPPPVDPPSDPGGGSNPPTGDTDPPDVFIDRAPARRTGRRKATFGFTADEAGATFECVIDNKPVRSCGSPKRYRRVGSGRHVFLVFATDAAGNLDDSPAIYRWRVTR